MPDSTRTHAIADSPAAAQPTVTGFAPDSAPDDPSRTADHPSAALREAPPPARVGRYSVVGEVARGGMGIVYRARDEAVGRDVAVKVLHARLRERPAAVARFVEEARITGRLQHPGIPPVFDVGRDDDGNPYFAMKLIKGGTLADSLGSGPAPQLLPEVERVCQAVGYAHERGVIHRDLKPANIMVGAYGEVQVMDWGLAKLLSDLPTGETTQLPTPEVTAIQDPRDDSDGSETQAGSVLGTPAYMPPEQAAGAVALIDRRADVFGLGAILCTVLTGKPPFLGDTADSTRLMAVQGRLESCFARLDACGADRDLIDLCKRCLCADPAERPKDAGEVARAIGAFRAATVDRARKAELEKSRRRWLVAVAVVLLLGTAAATGFGLWGMANARRADGEAKRADEEADAAKAEADKAIAAGRESQRLLGLMNVEDGMAQADRGRLATGLLRMSHALTLAPDHREIDDSVRMLFPGYRRYGRASAAALTHQIVFPGMTRTQRVYAFTPDGRMAFTSVDDNQSKVWDVASGRLLATVPGSSFWRASEPFSKDGRLVAVKQNDFVRVLDWSATPIREVASLRIEGQASVLALSSDAQRVAVREWKSKTCRVYDVARREPAGVPLPSDMGNFDRECRLYFAVESGQARVLDALTGRTISTLRVRMENYPYASFNPTRQFLATAGLDGFVSLWDAATGEPALGGRIATGRTYMIAWGPDGRRLATTGTDGTVRIWDLSSGRLLAALSGHAEFGAAIGFSPDGRQVVTGGSGGVVRVWDLAGGRGEFTGRGHSSSVYGLTWDAGGQRLVSSDFGGTVRVWDPAGGRPLLATMSHGTGRIWNTRISRDGTRILTTGDTRSIRVSNAATGATISTLEKVSDGIGYGLELCPDDQHAAVLRKDGSIRIFDIATGLEVMTLHPKDAQADVLEYRPDGRRLGVIYASGLASVWELATRRELWRAGPESKDLWGAYFSPDGRRLALPYDDGLVVVRDAETGAEVATFRGHTGNIRLAFTPDSRRIVSTGAEGTVCVWDVESGRQLLLLQGLTSRMSVPTVSPDGRRVSGTIIDGATRVWDIETGRVLTPPLGEGRVMAVRFSPDSKRLATGGADGMVRVFNLDPDDRPAVDLVATARLLSGQSVTPAGATVPVAPEELRSLYAGLREKYPADYAVTPAAIRAWREAEIRDCMKEGNLKAAEFHFWAQVAGMAE